MTVRDAALVEVTVDYQNAVELSQPFPGMILAANDNEDQVWQRGVITCTHFFILPW